MIRRPGQPKKVMSPWVPGGMGSEHFDRRIAFLGGEYSFLKMVWDCLNRLKGEFAHVSTDLSATMDSEYLTYSQNNDV